MENIKAKILRHHIVQRSWDPLVCVRVTVTSWGCGNVGQSGNLGAVWMEAVHPGWVQDSSGQLSTGFGFVS